MSEVLGSRTPYGITYYPSRKKRQDWCDYRQHYVNETQRPLFSTSRLRSLDEYMVCFECMLKYPKDGKFNGKGEDVPDTSEPLYTSGSINFIRSNTFG